jgi:NAD(P)-dependent dehydrogenase (short-subunit alcohol dehydrogenase family)
VTTTLNTGANKGLGFETARQLVAAGHQVWIGARDSARGRQAADDVGARFVQLDVTDDASVAAAAKTVEALDVLVNNAGISGGRISPSEATADDMRRVYETNVFGPVRVLHAFLPLLEDSEAPVVVNVSSDVPRVAGHKATAEELKSLSDTLDAWLKEWRAGNAG